MMAIIAAGTTISVGDTVTAQTLHNLIEQATITLEAADIQDFNAPFGLFAGASPPDTSLYRLWVSTYTRDQVVRVWSPAHDIWLTVGPDRFDFPLINNSGVTVFAGSLIVPSGSFGFTIATNPSLNVIGFLQEDTNPDAYGPVASCGYGRALFDDDADSQVIPNAAHMAYARLSVAGRVHTDVAANITGSAVSGYAYGMWITAGGDNYALITGPKTNSQVA